MTVVLDDAFILTPLPQDTGFAVQFTVRVLGMALRLYLTRENELTTNLRNSCLWVSRHAVEEYLEKWYADGGETVRETMDDAAFSDDADFKVEVVELQLAKENEQ